MDHPPRPGTGFVELPRGWIDRITPPLARFIRIEAAGGAILLLATVVAIFLANSPWAIDAVKLWETELSVRLGPYELARSLRSWINDGLMTLFFFLVALELKRELVLGEMRNPRLAALPLAAALGGMLAPAALYLSLQWGQAAAHGWGIAMATDTAFVIACLALLGPRVPHRLRVFMLFLAIVDDIGAIFVVALGYSHQLNWTMVGLAALCIGLLRGLSFAGVRGMPIYAVMGVVIWMAVDASGLHATVTGVILGLMAPARRWVSDRRLYGILGQVISHPTGSQNAQGTLDRDTLHAAEVAVRESLSPVERLEMSLHPWVSFGVLPLFALANAGVELTWATGREPVAMAVFLSFAIGKPLGVLLFCWLALRFGVAKRQPALRWIHLIGGGLLAGIGFTMALFIAGLALNGPLLESAKIGILAASIFSAIAGVAVLASARPGAAMNRAAAVAS